MKLAAALLAAALSSGCISTSSVLEDLHGSGSGSAPADLAAAARREFDSQPRTEARAVRAFDLMREAARATAPEAPERLPRLVLASRYGIWVARHAAGADLRLQHADAVIVVCNTAVRDAPERVEGYYYRAIAVGLLAKENNIYGPDAMGQIREDARRAIHLDQDYEHGGPHRVLGALHLRAPGPPAGPGSLRRAIHHLEQAVQLAPRHPENLLFLAEALCEAGREDEARPLLARLPGLIEKTGDPEARALWREWLAGLERGSG